MKAAELFIKALENEGVKYVFGIPGEENARHAGRTIAFEYRADFDAA